MELGGTFVMRYAWLDLIPGATTCLQNEIRIFMLVLKVQSTRTGVSVLVLPIPLPPARREGPSVQASGRKRKERKERHISLRFTLENLANNCDHPKKSTQLYE